MPFKGQTININNKGIRHTAQHINIDEHSKVALFLGGSTMWGQGANDEGTIASFFSKYAKGKYKAINLGESGYSAFQEYIDLNIRVANGLKPNLIVSYDGVNQLWSLLSGVDDFSYSSELQIREIMKGSNQLYDARGLSFDILYKPIKSFMERLLLRIDKRKYDFSDENILNAAQETIKSWKLIDDFAKINGAQYIIILQPNAYTGDPKTDHIKLHDGQQKGYDLLYGKIKELIKEPQNKEIANKFYDFTDAFDGDKYIYIDSYGSHVAPIGNEIIAKRLLKVLNDI